MLKLCQDVTQTDDVFIFDSDCVLLKPFKIYDEFGRRRLLTRITKNDESAYFRYMNIMSKGDLCDFTVDEYAETNYIADMQIFNR